MFFLIFIALLIMRITRGILKELDQNNKVRLFDMLVKTGAVSAIEALVIVLILRQSL